MFLNNLSIYSIPLIGIIFLIISLTVSKTINLFSYQFSIEDKKRQSIINHTNDSQNPHISIQINPFSQLDNHRLVSTRLPFNDDDDDDELIKSDLLSNFCENNSIELRLDQDVEYDNENNV